MTARQVNTAPVADRRVIEALNLIVEGGFSEPGAGDALLDAIQHIRAMRAEIRRLQKSYVRAMRGNGP